LDAFYSNGNFEEALGESDADPEEWVKEIKLLLTEAEQHLLPVEIQKCLQHLPMYELEKPKAENNFTVLQHFPFKNVQSVEDYFTSFTFEKGEDYIGKFEITSKFNTEEKYMVVKGKCKAVHLSGNYHQKICFTDDEIISSSCSCPVGHDDCKHLAALSAQIVSAIKKKKKK